MAETRAHVVYSGRVQGVGFRFTARSVARRFPVTGYVRNLRDGTVELEAQGEKSDVTACLGEIASTMRDYMAGSETAWIEPVEGEGGFSIRF